MLVNESRYDVENELKARMYQSRLLRICFIVVLPAVFVGLGIAFLFVNGVSLFFPVFLFVFAAASLVFFAFLYKPVMRRLIGKALQGQECDVVWTFSGEGFSVHAENTSLGNTENEPYSSLTKCEEYADMWLLSRGWLVLPLAKSGMTEGTAEELCVLLAVKLGDRYHVKYRKK